MFVLKMYVQIMSLSVLLCNVCVCYVYILKMSKKIKVKKKHYLFIATCVAYMSNWLFTSSKFHVGGGRNIRQGKPQMSAFSSHICVYM